MSQRNNRSQPTTRPTWSDPHRIWCYGHASLDTDYLVVLDFQISRMVELSVESDSENQRKLGLFAPQF